MFQTLQWTGSALRLLDQTKLPMETVYVDIVDERQMWDAIKRLVVRGAPAIGVAAAFGVYLGVRGLDGDAKSFAKRLDEVSDYLKSSRPTAVNLAWAVDRVQRMGEKELILRECMAMIEQDKQRCRAIGEHGCEMLRSIKPSGEINLLTHCNAGALATVAYGTALAPVYVGIERGIKFHVYADETRPLLQGSRITAWELHHAGVPTTVLCDNMAATLMNQKEIDAVIVGADRIAANGDVANKIGTHGLAIVARHFNVPFFVAAPTSTIDPACPSGVCIPIEQRDATEVTRGFGRATAPDGVNVFNPAFDVTPHELVSAIITEHGIAKPPFKDEL
ncbi:MAG: S-methyl-5-thioribose-1-phosphate isomerase [Anaerolineae bacterium]|nr:S-methyl-5-thioribose-1-phosphate isomerase [Phycisphaerae bacterium]